MTRPTFIAALLVLCLCGTALARRAKWTPKEKPPVSLLEAVEIAAAEDEVSR